MSARYEESDARVRPLLWFGAGLAVLIAVALVAARLLERSLEEADPEREAAHPMQAFRAGPEGPLLQAVPAQEREALSALEQRLLGTYGWVDRENAVARIPIRRAMELVARRGLSVLGASVEEDGG